MACSYIAGNFVVPVLCLSMKRFSGGFQEAAKAASPEII